MAKTHPDRPHGQIEIDLGVSNLTPKKKEITAHEYGIYLHLTNEELAKLTDKIQTRLKKAATVTILITEDFTEKGESVPVELFDEDKTGLFLPKGIQAKYLTIVPNLKIVRGTEGEALPVIRQVKDLLPLTTKANGERLTLDPGQLDILEEIFKRKEGGLIHSAMGSGKAMFVCALVYGLPLLRPVAVSGKGTKDVLQLWDWLKAFGEKNPDWKEDIILSGCGKTPNKAQLKKLATGEGIFLCTHAGLQNLPENVKLLIMDEAHASGTPKRIAQIFKRPKLKRIYGLSGTFNLRADGGDKLLTAICGPIFTTGDHEKFEATKRVAPTEIHVYNFGGGGQYLPNPADPREEPEEGYGMHQTWVENHRGRQQFLAELAIYLPLDETKVIFTPHIIHAVRIQKAILHAAKKAGVKFNPEQEPTLIHANTNKREGRHKAFYMSKEEQMAKVTLLKNGLLKLVICTDFLSTGVDTNMIDHVIDASGQKALITSIQRSGRGTRPRTNANGTEKINKVHIILDHTRKLLRILGEQKILALREYYGHMPGTTLIKNRVGGYFLHQQPPWNPEANPGNAGLGMPLSPADKPRI